MSADDGIPVRFLRAVVLERASRRTTPHDWFDKIAAVASLPLHDRTHADGTDAYEVHVDEGDSVLLVGALRAINTDFMTQIDQETGSIVDLLDKNTEVSATQFAHTTVMAFLPRHNAVAVARGGANAPRARSAVELFLKRHVSLPAGSVWFVEEIVAPAQTEKLKKAKGVTALEAHYETLSLLDSISPGANGIASRLDNFADQLGGELIIDVRARLAPGSRHGKSVRAMKDAVLADLARLASSKRQVKAKVVYDDDSTEILDLVAAKLSTFIRLYDDRVSSKKYSALLEGLRSVSVDMQSKVDEILGG